MNTQKSSRTYEIKRYCVTITDAAKVGGCRTWFINAKTRRGAVRHAVDKAMVYCILAKREDAIVEIERVG
jgi:hypothetical protein